jgi:hypothetical protein
MQSTTDLALDARLPNSIRLRNRPLQLAAGIALLLGLTLGVYRPALRTELVADDFSLVGQISFPDGFAYFGKSFGFGRNEYRPLTALSYAVDRALWQNNSEGYHLTNLLLHAATAGLFFLFLRALTGDFPLALLAGCLFVIHPINSSRIIWISARDGNVCGVFLLGALWLFVLSRRQDRRALHVLAVGLAACALLAYERAVILPALIFLTEFLFFAAGPLRERIASSFRRTASFWVLAAAYLCFWEVIFSTKVGGYDLSWSPLSIFDNYTRLLSNLFYGGNFYGRKQWVFGLAYILVLSLCYRMLMASRRLAAFGVLAALIAFLPYCFTHGFAFRFGYISALGISIFLAVCILAGLRSTLRLRRPIFACIGILLCSYYVGSDRQILSGWTAAGKIAARIPQAVRTLCPNPPEGTVLIFIGVPRRHGTIPVFPTGLGDAIQREYPVKVFVRQYDVPLAKLPIEARRGAIIFSYSGGEHPLRRVGLLPNGG